MKKELELKKCLHCGTIIKIIKNGDFDNSKIYCCGEPMESIKINCKDAALEKHVPIYNKIDDKIYVEVNHVMEIDHFIEWICLITDRKEEYIKLEPNEKAKAIFEDVDSGTLYAFCNKHGLFKIDIR